MCINDDLPEVRHLDPDSQALELQGLGTSGCRRKVRLGTGVVTASGLPGLSTARIATRRSMCGIGYRLPGPLVRAGHLHGIERVGVHDNPN